MPLVLEEYGAAVHEKLHALAVVAGVAAQTDSHAEGARKFIEAIRELNAKMQIPEKLTGIRKENIPGMAAHAAQEANPLYPVPVQMDAKALEKIYCKVADWNCEN